MDIKFEGLDELTSVLKNCIAIANANKCKSCPFYELCDFSDSEHFLPAILYGLLDV